MLQKRYREEGEVDSARMNKFLMIIIIGLLVALIVSVNSSHTVVVAGTADSAGSLAAVTGNTESQSRDLLYIVDGQGKSLCVYEFMGRKLNLVAARNIKFDLLLDEWRPNSQTPSVKDVYKETQKKTKEDTKPGK
jgi:hypothetical protein